jgi:ubiquitin fusion degradation protein 1
MDFSMFGMGGGGRAGMMMGGNRRFETQYMCFSAAMAGRSGIDEGDKILLPPSALEVLARMNVEYPMLFELKNDALNKKTHCGVLEFSAEEGKCFMPFWMMQNMVVSSSTALAETEEVNLTNSVITQRLISANSQIT